MMENYELADMIFRNLSDGYDDEEHRAETVITLYNELSQLPDNSYIKIALSKICERIEELEM